MFGSQQFGFAWPNDGSASPYPDGRGHVEQEIAKWLEDVKFRTKSRDTYRSRRSQIRHFQAWCARCGVLRVEDVTRDVLRRYLQETRDGGYALSSLRTRANIVRVWMRWLADEGLILHAPRIETPKPEQVPPDVPTIEQIEAVVRACEDGTPIGYRDRALVLLLYGSGCRVSEASKLDISDLDLENLRARVKGKGGRTRVAGLTPRAADALRTYIERFRIAAVIPKHADAVFVSRAGTRVSTDIIRRAVKARGESVGFHGAHPHLFRHAAATHMLDAGADLYELKTVLGHVHVTTTEVYAHVHADAIRRTVERFHPHARPRPADPAQGGPP